MKKQAALLLGICSGTRYLFCDETFDGLDPVMRQGVKSIFASEMEERGLPIHKRTLMARDWLLAAGVTIED